MPPSDLSMSTSPPDDERPRERLLACGPQALSSAELLALILGTGTRARSSLAIAGQLLADASGLAGLARLTPPVLARQCGVGLAKAARIAAAIELGRRAVTTPTGQRPLIASLSDAAALLVPRLKDHPVEHLVVMLLDPRRRLLRTVEVYQGTVDGLQISAAEVFRPAIEAGASAILLAHNHPSGDPRPSAADVAATRVLVRAGEVLGIDLIDHLVVADTTWFAIRADLGGSLSGQGRDPGGRGAGASPPTCGGSGRGLIVREGGPPVGEVRRPALKRTEPRRAARRRPAPRSPSRRNGQRSTRPEHR